MAVRKIGHVYDRNLSHLLFAFREGFFLRKYWQDLMEVCDDRFSLDCSVSSKGML